MTTTSCGQHTSIIGWNNQFLTPGAISVIVVRSQPATVISKSFETFQFPMMFFRQELCEITVRGFNCLTRGVVPKKYSICRGLWNISPADENACCAHVMTMKVDWWAWRCYKTIRLCKKRFLKKVVGADFEQNHRELNAVQVQLLGSIPIDKCMDTATISNVHSNFLRRPG